MELALNCIHKRLLVVTLATLLVAGLALPCAAPASAWADDVQEQVPDIVELQSKVDEAAATYDDANRRIAEIEAQISKTGDEIFQLSIQLPDAKKKSGKAAAEYYRLMSTSSMLLDLIFGATSMSDFIANMEYTLRVNQSYLTDIGLLNTLNTELALAQDKLQADKQAVEDEKLKAEEALQDAQYARNAAESTANRIAEESAAATAAAAAAAAAAAKDPEPPLTPTPEAPSSPTTPTPEAPADEAVDDKQSFVDLWSKRIDTYLSGSPMDGTGWYFANAAWDYDVDPRWSPAISCLESSMGRYCFMPFNAWGWGSVSWDSWESAIYGHVKGLAVGYGHSISREAAERYCPPNAEHWYDFVSGQMELI